MKTLLKTSVIDVVTVPVLDGFVLFPVINVFKHARYSRSDERVLGGFVTICFRRFQIMSYRRLRVWKTVGSTSSVIDVLKLYVIDGSVPFSL